MNRKSHFGVAFIFLAAWAAAAQGVEIRFVEPIKQVGDLHSSIDHGINQLLNIVGTNPDLSAAMSNYIDTRFFIESSAQDNALSMNTLTDLMIRDTSRPPVPEVRDAVVMLAVNQHKIETAKLAQVLGESTACRLKSVKITEAEIAAVSARLNKHEGGLQGFARRLDELFDNARNDSGTSDPAPVSAKAGPALYLRFLHAAQAGALLRPYKRSAAESKPPFTGSGIKAASSLKSARYSRALASALAFGTTIFVSASKAKAADSSFFNQVDAWRQSIINGITDFASFRNFVGLILEIAILILAQAAFSTGDWLLNRILANLLVILIMLSTCILYFSVSGPLIHFLNWLLSLV